MITYLSDFFVDDTLPMVNQRQRMENSFVKFAPFVHPDDSPNIPVQKVDLLRINLQF